MQRGATRYDPGAKVTKPGPSPGILVALPARGRMAKKCTCGSSKIAGLQQGAGKIVDGLQQPDHVLPRLSAAQRRHVLRVRATRGVDQKQHVV